MKCCSSTPIVVSNHPDTYVNPNGRIFMTVGTAGAEQYRFAGQAPYIAKQFQRFGFLNINIIDNETSMVGTFYDSQDGTCDKDRFTIVKNISNNVNWEPWDSLKLELKSTGNSYSKWFLLLYD